MLQEVESKTAGRVECDEGMSNFDHSIDDGLAEALADGTKYAIHSAWNFNGLVYVEDGGYVEEVWQYHHIVGYVRADTLPELMAEVNAEYGAQ